jgi:lysozyme family protein
MSFWFGNRAVSKYMKGKIMEANFFKSLEMVLHHEGGFVSHPEDPGGATNKGITHKTYCGFFGPPLEDVDELKNIPDEHVQLIYKNGLLGQSKGR